MKPFPTARSWGNRDPAPAGRRGLSAKLRQITVRAATRGSTRQQNKSRFDGEDRMRTTRASTVAIILAAIGLIAPAQAQAPAGDATRPITLVVPIAAGGGMDTIGRAVAEKLSERLKQTVVVENRTRAGGVVGVDYVAKAA